MEDSQWSTIRTCLPFLLNNTNCSIEILSWLSDVLTDHEIQSIRSEWTQQDKAYQLYDIMRRKVDGYDILAKALLKTKQTKPAEALLSSAILSKISCCQINIPGVSGKLTDFVTKEELQDGVRSVLRTSEASDLYEVYKTILITANQIKLKNTIPLPASYYIPRNLYARRVFLDPGVFKVACSDVFIFKCSHPVQLLYLLRNEKISCSSKQLVNVSARFISLKQDADWKIIREKSKHPTHLVNYTFLDGQHSCLLEDSTAGSSVIHQYLHHQPNANNVTITEQEFLYTAMQTKGPGICICDKPGMGKSVLLANLARHAKAMHPERLVLFLPLSIVSEAVSAAPQAGTVLFQDIVLEQISYNATSRFILKKLIKFGETPIELFLDGFDEVRQEQIQDVKNFLLSAREVKNTRLYVTSRINTRKDLERSLGVLAYDIQPFSEAQQIEFLVSSWQTKYPENDRGMIEKFSRVCLKMLSKTINGKEREITGIPLLCRLVADVYSDNANIYSQPGRNGSTKMELLDNTTLFLLYTKYMERQLGTTLCDFNCLFNKTMTNCTENCKRRSQHSWIAIQTLFPELAAKLQKFTVKMDTNEFVVSAGLLETRFGQFTEMAEFELAHRTFAEYLATDLITRFWFVSPVSSCQKQVQDILVNFTLSSLLRVRKFIKMGIIGDFKSISAGDEMFENEVCAYFFEACLKNTSRIFRIGKNDLLNSKYSSNLADMALILYGSIGMNYEKTSLLALHAVTGSEDTESRCWYSRFFSAESGWRALFYSFMAVWAGNVTIVEPLLSYFHHTLQILFVSPSPCFDAYLGLKKSLELAIESEDMALVQCVSKFWSFYEGDVLRSCLKIKMEGTWLDEYRLNLCMILVAQAMGLDNTSPAFGYVGVIKGIVKLQRANSLFQDKDMRYYVCLLLSKAEFLELQKFLWEIKQVDLSIKDYNRFVRAVVKYPKSKLSRTKLENLKSLCLNPVSFENFLTDIFYEAIKHGRSLEELKLLVEWGAIYSDNLRVEKGRTALHWAVFGKRSFQTVEYLITLGLSLDTRDWDGNSPLHLATINKNLELMKFFIKKGCNLQIRNAHGSTFLQQAATWKGYYKFNDEEAFLDLVVFLKGFAGASCFWKEGGIFREGLKARYGDQLPNNVKMLLL